jgi:hypothetical protein
MGMQMAYEETIFVICVLLQHKISTKLAPNHVVKNVHGYPIILNSQYGIKMIVE